MLVILMSIYVVACTVVGWHGAVALYHMGRRTPHMRRITFLLFAAAGVFAWFEAFNKLPPALSAMCLAGGACLLLRLGARGTQRPPTLHRGPNSVMLR
jgi:predicted membrane channel-forming protein YqfA (hemolysin III family)